MSDIENAAFMLAREWLLNSGIQQQSEGPFYGSFADWLDVRERKYNAAYPEITGYGVQALMWLNSLSADGELPKKAEIAADWLLGRAAVQFDAGIGFRDKIPFEKAAGEQVVFAFDTGMALEGLVSLHEKTHDAELLSRMGRVASWLASLVDSEGRMKPYESSVKLPVKWSSQSGSFHTKVANAMLRYAKIRKDEKIKAAAHSVCKFALGRQSREGRFITDASDESTYMHAHCYTIEGLFSIGIREKREGYIAAALNAARWLLQAQLPSGGISRIYMDGKFSSDEGADILSQTVRIWLIAKRMGEAGFETPLQNALKRLSTFQIKNGGKMEKGGMLYGFNKGKLVRNVNSWATMFALQAFWMAAGNNAEKFNADFIV